MAGKGEIDLLGIQPLLNDNWQSISFEEAIDKPEAFVKLKSNEFKPTGKYPVIDQGEKFISGYIDDINLLYSGEIPVIIFGDHTRNIKYIDFEFAVGADGTKILKAKNTIITKFFYYYLKSLKIPSFGYSRHYKVLKKIYIPIPPLTEQKHIVEKLDALFSHLDILKIKLDKIPELFKDFRQQVLMHAVTGKLTEEWRKRKGSEAWKEVELKELSISITDGDHQAPPQVDEGIPFLVISNVSNGKLKIESASRFVPLEYYNALKDNKKPQLNDILYTVTGTIGIPVIVDKGEPFTFQRHIAIIRPDKRRVVPYYLYYILMSDYCFRQGLSLATGTAQITIPINGLRSYIIPLPPLKEQKEIVKQITELFSLVDKIENQYQNLKNKVDNLPQALLNKAFGGELVPQNPNIEPASILLESVKKEKGGNL